MVTHSLTLYSTFLLLSLLCRLSLAMFEALRGLRDAVAPESGNLGGNAAANNTNNGSSSDQGDFEEFWSLYRSGDPATVALVQRYSSGSTTSTPQRREDMVRIHGRIEMEKDVELVTKLAGTVLEKSDEINERVSSLPGMERTRTQQMETIATLLELNQQAAQELEQQHVLAKERRDQVRLFVKENTCQALGIVDGDLV